MLIVKVALVLFAAAMLGFVVAGIVFTHLRFFIWLGVVGLIAWAIYSVVTSRRSS
jgi:hypothetical protein